MSLDNSPIPTDDDLRDPDLRGIAVCVLAAGVVLLVTAGFVAALVVYQIVRSR